MFKFDVAFKYERDLKKQLDKLIEVADLCCWRVPLGPILISIGKKKIGIPNPLKGFPDYAGVVSRGEHRGKLYVIELKSEKGRFSDKQKWWLSRLERAGALVCKPRSMNDINDFTKKYDIC